MCLFAIKMRNEKTVSKLLFKILLSCLFLVTIPVAAAEATGGLMKVKLSTNKGDITLELDAEKAPITVENFVNYVKSGHYNGTIFHRVIDEFMIQGGGMDVEMKQKETGDTIQNEANNGLKNEIGTIAMARTSAPHSASAQFFINTQQNDFLNFRSESMDGWGYCVFGKVVEGMDVVEDIEAVKTTIRDGHQDVPAENVIIETAEMVE